MRAVLAPRFYCSHRQIPAEAAADTRLVACRNYHARSDYLAVQCQPDSFAVCLLDLGSIQYRVRFS